MADMLSADTFVASLADWSAELTVIWAVRRRNDRDPERIEQVLTFLKANVAASS